MSIDLTNLSPEARAELERALSASKGAGASSGSPAPGRPNWKTSGLGCLARTTRGFAKPF